MKKIIMISSLTVATLMADVYSYIDNIFEKAYSTDVTMKAFFGSEKMKSLDVTFHENQFIRLDRYLSYKKIDNSDIYTYKLIKNFTIDDIQQFGIFGGVSYSTLKTSHYTQAQGLFTAAAPESTLYEMKTDKTSALVGGNYSIYDLSSNIYFSDDKNHGASIEYLKQINNSFGVGVGASLDRVQDVELKSIYVMATYRFHTFMLF